MVDLKQQLETSDYFGAIAVWCVFFTILGVLSLIFNYTCIKQDDDVTALERWGYRKNLGIRLGPHRKSVIARQIPITIHSD